MSTIIHSDPDDDDSSSEASSLNPSIEQLRRKISNSKPAGLSLSQGNLPHDRLPSIQSLPVREASVSHTEDDDDQSDHDPSSFLTSDKDHDGGGANEAIPDGKKGNHPEEEGSIRSLSVGTPSSLLQSSVGKGYQRQVSSSESQQVSSNESQPPTGDVSGIPVNPNTVSEGTPPVQAEKSGHKVAERANSSTPIDDTTLTSSTSSALKITVRFQPIGSTRILSSRVFKIARDRNISTLILFIRKQIGVETVYLYIQSSFQPNPDENLGTLFDLYKTGDELIISYCDTVAFG